MARGRTARDRVIDAAVELFAEHGVQGTSLQMIADRLGVAKGAVYYQFRSKDDLVLALLRPLFDAIAELVSAGESIGCAQQRRATALRGLVDLALAQRQATCLFGRDPVVDQLIAGDDELRGIAERLHEQLLGPDPDDAGRVALAMAINGLYYCATDPDLRDIPDAQLRATLLRNMERCVSGSGSPAANPPRPAERQPAAALRDSALCR
jgi:AcrR family transcriptional regulator